MRCKIFIYTWIRYLQMPIWLSDWSWRQRSLFCHRRMVWLLYKYHFRSDIYWTAFFFLFFFVSYMILSGQIIVIISMRIGGIIYLLNIALAHKSGGTLPTLRRNPLKHNRLKAWWNENVSYLGACWLDLLSVRSENKFMWSLSHASPSWITGVIK